MAYDPALKVLVETIPEDWPAFVHLPTGPTDVLDADVATVSGAADKVLRVRAAEPYLLHLEFQACHDAATLPDLLHVRNALLDHRHGLPVRSVAVLLRPEADSPRLTGVRQRTHAGREVDVFRYDVVRVWQTPVEEVLSGGLGTLPLAPLCAVTEAELPGIIEQMKARLAGRAARRQARGLWAATYVLLGVRWSPDVAAMLLRGVLSMKESSTYQAILQEGEALGLAKGRTEGRAEGRAEGAVAEARRILLRLGTQRYGAPTPAQAKALERVADLAVLEGLSDRLLVVNSWAELVPEQRARRKPG